MDIVGKTTLARWLAICAPAAVCAGLPSLAAADEAALFDAAKRGDRIAISRALDEGANASARAVDETTPLHWAARADSVDASTALLDAGADAAAADRYGITPLYL